VRKGVIGEAGYDLLWLLRGRKCIKYSDIS